MLLFDPLARPVIAHRGASGDFPENTLLAFRQALLAGADALEFDVRTTRDGVPVVIHDAMVNRTTDGAGLVVDMELGQLRGLDVGAGEPIPTLAEVLDSFVGVPMIMEVKVEAAAEPALTEISRRQLQSHLLVGSFEHKALRPFQRARWPTTASRRQTALFWAGSRVGARIRAGPYVAFSVPEYSGHVHVVDPRFTAMAARAGLPVHVWTVDDTGTAARLRRTGVAGIVTNFPERMGELPS